MGRQGPCSRDSQNNRENQYFPNGHLVTSITTEKGRTLNLCNCSFIHELFIFIHSFIYDGQERESLRPWQLGAEQRSPICTCMPVSVHTHRHKYHRQRLCTDLTRVLFFRDMFDFTITRTADKICECCFMPCCECAL